MRKATQVKILTGRTLILAGLGAAAAAWARRSWIRHTAQQWVAERLEEIEDLLIPVDNPRPIIDGVVYGNAPHKVLEAYRFADGDAFLIAVADTQGDVFYGLCRGLVPAPADEPNFETSLELLRIADEAAETGDVNAQEICLNFNYALIPVPEDDNDRAFVRRATQIMLEAHGENVAAEVSSDPTKMMLEVERGFLYRSPLVKAAERIEKLT